jgi:hypothetical protein
MNLTENVLFFFFGTWYASKVGVYPSAWVRFQINLWMWTQLHVIKAAISYCSNKISILCKGKNKCL